MGLAGPNISKEPMFSQTAEYALRVVVFLGGRSEPATTRQISQAAKIPEGYLSKVLQSLSRRGIIKSQRGLHGGSTLAKDPHDLTVYDIVEAVDVVPRILTCPLDIKSHGALLCPLHRRMDQALATVEKALRDSTIADLLEEENPSKPLCETGNMFEEKNAELTIAGKKR
jgi:Rrf2 family nitric oxide-sensitive transcriptional repressor